MAAYIDSRTSWTGVPLTREALPLASDHWSSPPEVKMGLIWELDAGFPRPLYNRAVFDRAGNLLGYPDLLDPVAGIVGEYAGAHHRDPEQHRADVAREELFSDHSLEYFTVVGKDLHSPAVVVERMRRARARAKFLPPESCSWTLEPPAWWTRPLHR